MHLNVYYLISLGSAQHKVAFVFMSFRIANHNMNAYLMFSLCQNDIKFVHIFQKRIFFVFLIFCLDFALEKDKNIKRFSSIKEEEKSAKEKNKKIKTKYYKHEIILT